MTEEEFLQEYRKCYQNVIDGCKKEIESISEKSSRQINEKISELSAHISNKGNILVSEIMARNNLNYNHLVIYNFQPTPISSVLYHKTFGLQLEIKKDYKEFVTSVLLEAVRRDSPSQDCLKDL